MAEGVLYKALNIASIAQKECQNSSNGDSPELALLRQIRIGWDTLNSIHLVEKIYVKALIKQ